MARPRGRSHRNMCKKKIRVPRGTPDISWHTHQRTSGVPRGTRQILIH
ncbi:MAG TPA: hypothetical protein VF779_05765 [Pyrinomonadaceae bacterium]